MNACGIEDMRREISYNPDTGVMAWRAARAGINTKAASAGSLKSDGYRQVQINGRRHYAHRLAWALHYGAWPADQIDHINGNRDDNRISNLRAVTRSENMRNQKLHATNSSGRAGVGWHSPTKKWQARISHGGKGVHLGLFDSFADACAAREAAEREYGFHENHGHVQKRTDSSVSVHK